MGSCTRFRVTQHGVWLARELKNTLHNRPPDISLVCSDGPFGLHLAILAPRLSSHLSRLLKAHWMGGLSDEPVSVMLPDFSCQDVQSLASLLYTGSTGPITSDAVERLKDLTRLLKITSIPVSAVRPEEQETEEKPEPRIRAEIVKKVLPPDTEKQPNNKSPAVEEDADGGIRRSKRPRVKSKRLDDYDVGQLGAKEQQPDDSDSDDNEQPTETLSVFRPTYVKFPVTTDDNKSDPRFAQFSNIPVTDELLETLKQKEVNQENLPQRPTWKSNFVSSDNKGLFKLCYVCDQSVLGLHNFTKHLRIHTDDKGPYKCQLCSKTVVHGLALHEHMRAHFKGLIADDGNEVNRCDEPGCSHEFRTKNALLKHVSVEHSLSRQNTYRCQEAGCQQVIFTCFSAKSFTEHMLKRHDKKPFECDECGTRFMYKCTLEDHIKAKHGDPEPDIPCDFCGKCFRTRANLMVHRREQHELGEKRLVKCDICNFVSKGWRNLRKHKERHDESSYRKFQCVYCSRMFRCKNSLVVHERVHTGEKPYMCNVCSVSFKRIHHLYTHLKSASHTGHIKQLEAGGQALPKPIYTVRKNAQTFATPDKKNKSTTSKEDPSPLKVGEKYTVDIRGQPIYMEVTEIDGSPTVQVVVPGDLTGEEGEESAATAAAPPIVVTSNEDYKQFVID